MLLKPKSPTSTLPPKATRRRESRRTPKLRTPLKSDIADINGEGVIFENHSIVCIDASYKLGYSYVRQNGKKKFYRENAHRRNVIAAAKITEDYMAEEIADEQKKFFPPIFKSLQTQFDGNDYRVSCRLRCDSRGASQSRRHSHCLTPLTTSSNGKQRPPHRNC